MPLSFYLAGSSSSGSDLQRYLQIIRETGHHISFDWTVHPNVKPYHENEAQARGFAEQALEAAGECDVFVLFPGQEGGTTQFTELGVAIASSRVQKIFVIGPWNTRSLAFFHPRVTRMETFEEVLKQLPN